MNYLITKQILLFLFCRLLPTACRLPPVACRLRHQFAQGSAHGDRDGGEGAQGRPQLHQVAGGGHAGALGDAVDGALHIAHLAERLAQLGAHECLVHAAGHSGLAGLERGQVEQGLGDPAAQQARTHRRAGAVENVHQGGLAARGGTLQQLQVAPGLRVEEHKAAGGIDPQAAELGGLVALGLVDILEQGTGGAGGQGPVVEAEGRQRVDAQLAQQRLLGGLGIPAPSGPGRHVALGPPGIAGLVEAASNPLVGQQQVALALGHRGQVLGEAGLGGGQLGQAQAHIVGDENLGDLEPREFAVELGGGPLAAKLDCGKLAGTQVGVGQANPLALDHCGGQIVIGRGGEHRGVNDRAGGDHPDDLAVDHLALKVAGGRLLDAAGEDRLRAGIAARRLGLAELLGNRDPVATAHQVVHVALDRVVGHAGHRREELLLIFRQALIDGEILAGEGDVEQFGDQLGVIVKGLVKVTEAKEQDRVGGLGLQLAVLAVPLVDLYLGHEDSSRFLFRQPCGSAANTR